MNRDFVRRVKAALEALAVGDALGMPVEYMTYDEIKTKFGFVERLLNPSVSRIHSNLPKGAITDDTEQVLYLIHQYLKDKNITVDGTVRALLQWYEAKAPATTGYIGPSSRKALERLKSGELPEVTGIEGVTCGGAMRMPAVALCTPRENYDQLIENVYAALLPTHNTNLAIEGAAALAFGMHAAASGARISEVMERSLQGAKLGRTRGRQLVGASTEARIRLVISIIAQLKNREQIMRFLYSTIGTEMFTNQVVPVIFGIVLYSHDNPWQAICMGASIGGDTDTIAGLSGFFTTLLTGEHNIPREVVHYVISQNQLVLDEIAYNIVQEFWQGL